MASNKEEIKVEIEVDDKDASKKVGDFRNKMNDLGDSVEETGKKAGKLPGVFGEMAESIVSFGSGIISATKAAIAFIATPLGLILTGVAVAIAAVKAAFEDSEEGQNKWAKIMTVIGALMDKLIDVLANLGDMIIKAFEDPQKSIKEFAKLIKDNIINRFVGMLELVPKLGKAINQLFHGDFKTAGKTALDAVAKVTLGVENLSDKLAAAGDAISQFAKDAEEAAKTASKVADMRAKADKVDRALLVDRAKLESQIASNREIALDKENESFAARKAALKEVDRLNGVLYAKEKEAITLRLEAKKLEDSMHGKTKEDLDEEAQLQARLNELETKRSNDKKILNKQERAINTEIIADEKAKAKVIEDETKEKERLAKEYTDAAMAEFDKQSEAAQKAADADYNAFKDAQAKKIEIAKQVAAQSESILNSVTTIMSNADQDRLNNENLTDEERLKLKNEIAEREFKTKKALGLVNAGISTAEAIAKSTPNIPLMAFSAIAGALQIAAIASTHFTPEQGSSVPRVASPPSAPRSDSGSAASSGGSSFSAPQLFNLGSTNPNQQLGQNGQPVLVVGDVNKGQHRIQVIDSFSRH